MYIVHVPPNTTPHQSNLTVSFPRPPNQPIPTLRSPTRPKKTPSTPLSTPDFLSSPSSHPRHRLKHGIRPRLTHNHNLLEPLALPPHQPLEPDAHRQRHACDVAVFGAVADRCFDFGGCSRGRRRCRREQHVARVDVEAAGAGGEGLGRRSEGWICEGGARSVFNHPFTMRPGRRARRAQRASTLRALVKGVTDSSSKSPPAHSSA